MFLLSFLHIMTLFSLKMLHNSKNILIFVPKLNNQTLLFIHF